MWTFEVEGNEKVSEEEILSSLEEFGLKVGSYIGAVDVRKLQQQMLLKFDDLAWIGININSSVAEILVHERVFPPQQERNDDGLFNIVASESGQIKRLEVYSGQPVVQVGEAVNAGDLIVSGIVEDPKGNATLRHARAKVLALVPFNKEFVIDLKESFSYISRERSLLYEFGSTSGVEYLDTVDLYDFVDSISKYSTYDVDNLLNAIDEAVVYNNTNIF